MPIYEYRCRSCEQEFEKYVHRRRDRGGVSHVRQR